MRVECPDCGEDIYDEVTKDDNWSDTTFLMDCPKCGAGLDIEVYVEEYSYKARRDDNAEHKGNDDEN